jgi:hypothetical protein
LGSQDAVLSGQISVPQLKFLVYGSGDVSQHACPKHFAFPPNLQPRESVIVDAVFQSEKSIRGEPVEAASYAISTRLSFLTIREGKSILLYELVEAFKSLLSVYGNLTGANSERTPLSEAVYYVTAEGQ